MDFKLIAQTPITDVVAMLGLDLKEVEAKIGKQLVGRCPISGSNNATAFKITPSLNRFICFCENCKKQQKPGGDCIELVSRVRKITAQEAARAISGLDKAAETPAEKQEVPPPSPSSRFDPAAFLAKLDPTHESIVNLGLSSATCKAFRAGYSKSPSLKGRIAVGLCELDGTPKAFVGVGVDGEELAVPSTVTLPFYLGAQLVEEEEPLHVYNDVLSAMNSYENGVRSLLVLLKPITVDLLTCLGSLMREKKSTTLEICY